MGVRAYLHNAPGAALLTFFQLVVYDELSRLQHRHKKRRGWATVGSRFLLHREKNSHL